MAGQVAPAGLGPAGRRLWSELTRDFDFDGADRVVLGELCATVDVIGELKAILKQEGLLCESPQGIRAHPAEAMLRARQLVLVRLSRALKLPDATPAAPRRRRSSGLRTLRPTGGTA